MGVDGDLAGWKCDAKASFISLPAIAVMSDPIWVWEPPSRLENWVLSFGQRSQTNPEVYRCSLDLESPIWFPNWRPPQHAHLDQIEGGPFRCGPVVQALDWHKPSKPALLVNFQKHLEKISSKNEKERRAICLRSYNASSSLKTFKTRMSLHAHR